MIVKKYSDVWKIGVFACLAIFLAAIQFLDFVFAEEAILLSESDRKSEPRNKYVALDNRQAAELRQIEFPLLEGRPIRIEEREVEASLHLVKQYLQELEGSSRTIKTERSDAKAIAKGILSSYVVQYASVDRKATRLLILYSVSKELADGKPRGKLIIIDDGGSSVWRAIYNLSEKKVVEFSANGEA